MDGAGGGGIGGVGEDHLVGNVNGGAGGNGLNQVTINGISYPFSNHFNITANSGYIGGGGGGGNTTNGNYGSGGEGGGGGGPLGGIEAQPNTGSGGGGGSGDASGNRKGGAGGSGIVILRFKIKETLDNNSLTALTDNTSAVNDKITTTTTLSSNKSNIKANTLSSFIFLQRGTYKFRAGFEGQNNILYSELIIYEGSDSIVYSYNDNKAATEITIAVGKFYKLAFRYIYCNFSNSDVDLSFNIKCEKQNLDLTNYLFGGANIKGDYANITIMNLFSDVKYTGNSDTTYNLIKGYLDTINFFNINALEAIRVAKKNYRDYELPAIIAANYVSDTNIININRVINTIDRLKSNNNANNYSSSLYLPTGTRSIYKDATIDEIFGKNYERLVTKERVSNYSEISNTTTIRPKKIYVEAVA